MIEHQHIEWKETWRDEFLKWICGFANADGGVIHVGRNDKGVVVGLAHAVKLLEEIPNKVRDILGIMVQVNLCEESKHEYLEIVVEPYPYPVSYKGEYHYRSGSTKQELKGAALDQFLLHKQGKHWDGVPVPHVALKDLSKSAIDRFRELARQNQRMDVAILRESAQKLVEKLRLRDGSHLKRAAVLLFHPDPEQFITAAFVKIGFFRTHSDLLYHDEVHGDLFTQAEKTIDLLRTKYLKAGIRYKGLQRQETFPVPDAALREAVLNALVHKDYSSGTPIQISVYPDKLMIWNPGELPPKWTVAKLKGKHPSQPFNPDVANAFFRAGMIEAWGRGIERIMESCRAARAAKPALRYEPSGIWIEFSYPEIAMKAVLAGFSDSKTTQETYPKDTTQETENTTQITRENTQRSENTTQETYPKDTTQETENTTQEKIIDLLKTQPLMTQRDLSDKIGISSNGIKYHLTRLKSAGRIRHVGPTKSGRWEVLK